MQCNATRCIAFGVWWIMCKATMTNPNAAFGLERFCNCYTVYDLPFGVIAACVVQPSTTPIYPAVSIIMEGTLPLAQLNVSSANFGAWNVQIYKPSVQRYEYMYQGKPRKGCNFRCVLISATNPQEYMYAEVGRGKNGDESKLRHAEKHIKTA